MLTVAHEFRHQHGLSCAAMLGICTITGDQHVVRTDKLDSFLTFMHLAAQYK